MSYKTQIYDIIIAAWPLPAGASSASEASIDNMANEIAESVANSVQADLVDALGDVVTELKTFMNAVTSTATVPNDGGSAYKIGLSTAATPAKTALATLAGRIATFQG